MACHDQENLGLIECFKNRLRKLITVEPLLDLLYFLEDEDKALIRVKLTTEGNLGAVDQLLETITKVARPLGWFREFIDALEAVGCSQAAKYIINSPPSPALEAENDSCVKLINLLHLSLVKMKTRDVCDSCCSLDILTEEDRENIFAEIERQGNISGARLLLRRLVRNEAGWFSTFLKALQMTGHPDLVKELMGEDLFDSEESTEGEKPPGQTDYQETPKFTTQLYEFLDDDDTDEIDLYTDPSEQKEQASGNEGKDSCTSDAGMKDQVAAVERPPVAAREMSPPKSPDGTQDGPDPPSASSSDTPVAKKTQARVSLSGLLVDDWERDINPTFYANYEQDLDDGYGGRFDGEPYDTDTWDAGDGGILFDDYIDPCEPATWSDYDPYY